MLKRTLEWLIVLNVISAVGSALAVEIKHSRAPASISPVITQPDALDLSRIKPEWYTSAKMPELRFRPEPSVSLLGRGCGLGYPAGKGSPWLK